MQTRRDLYQAHRLMMQRVGLALLMGEPDIAESPTRRLTVGAVSGAMVAVLIAAIFGVWGFLSPSGTSGLNKAGVIIMEKETGALYIWSGSAMDPVVNYTSARLALAGNTITQRSVAQTSLDKYSIGPEIGIPQAPTSLPSSSQLINGPWSLCLKVQANPQGKDVFGTTLVAGKDVGGSGLNDQTQAAVVQDNAGFWVIWDHERHLMQASLPVVTGTTKVPSVPTVPDSWVNGIPEGANFDPPDVGDIGANVPGGVFDQPNARVGQIYESSNGLWYVLTETGLSRISQTQEQLLINEPSTGQAYPGGNVTVLHISAAQANGQQGKPLYNATTLPATMPNFQVWTGDVPLCAVYSNSKEGSTSPDFSIGGNIPATTAYDGATQVSISMPTGAASIAGDLQDTGKSILSYYLIDDQGTKFQIIQKSLITALGYKASATSAGGNITPVPALILSLLPTGPALSQAAARTPVPGTR